MARRSGASARTLALTKAQEAVAQRDAERIRREKQLEAALVDYYQAQGEVERIHREADLAARPFEATIREAVCSLGRVGESRVGIAELTGLTLPQVRDYLTDLASSAPMPEELARQRRPLTTEVPEEQVPAMG